MLMRCLVLISALLLSGRVCAEGNRAMAARLDRIERRLERLEHADEKHWLTARRAAQLRTLAADVLRDADTRAALANAAPLAGYDRGFFVASADSRFRIALDGQIQSRYIWARQSDAPAGERVRNGFDLRRVRLRFHGHAINPRLTFEFGLDAAGRIAPALQRTDAYINWAFNERSSLRLGRFLLPVFLRESMVSSKRQLLTDRSLLHAGFDIGPATGLYYEHRANRATVNLGLLDPEEGILGDRTPAAVARVDVQLLGDRAAHGDFSSFPGEEPAVSVGAGLLWMHRRAAAPMSFDADTLRWTADVSAELGGATLFAAFVGAHIESDDPLAPRVQYGVVVQGGAFLCESVELAARYVWADADDGAENLSVATLGVNWFIDGHALKLTCDAGYAFNAVGPFWSSTTRGWRTDAPGADGQVVIRTQFQLLF